MPKARARQKTTTHFEQVPVQSVIRLAKEASRVPDDSHEAEEIRLSVQECDLAVDARGGQKNGRR